MNKFYIIGDSGQPISAPSTCLLVCRRRRILHEEGKPLIEDIKDITLEPGHILDSVDVISLFTNVPAEEDIQTIQTKHQPRKSIIKLIKHCLKNTYFSCKEQKILANGGCADGLTTVADNIELIQARPRRGSNRNSTLETRIMATLRGRSHSILVTSIGGSSFIAKSTATFWLLFSWE